jgi:hypothetical protein
MYGLPSDTDLNFLLSATLTQVCIGENEIILNLHPAGAKLSPRIEIMSASSIRLCRNGEDWSTFSESVIAAPAVLGLLGETISKTSIVGTGTLRIGWSSGTELELLDTFDRYESYTIKHSEEIIVV